MPTERADEHHTDEDFAEAELSSTVFVRCSFTRCSFRAARLIEACGLKGRVEGGAMISDKHANFIVNTGGTRAADIEALIELAHSAVLYKFKVDLEREVRIVGDK